MSRPQPRQSKLAGMSAVTPAPAAEKPAPDNEQPADAGTERKGERHSSPAARNPDGTRKTRHKIAVYMTEDDADRARAAMIETSIPSREGPRSWSQFVVDAVLKETARLEREYNGGDQWPPVEAWQIPQGRPTGSRTKKK